MPVSEDTVAMPMTGDHFRTLFRDHPGGVALITADPGEGMAPVALTATSVVSLSSEPPTMAFSVSDRSSSTPALRAAESVVVHFLDASGVHLARLGSTSGIDRFADSRLWRRLDTGEPYFIDARAWARARVVGRLEVPGATLLAVEGETVGFRDPQASASAPAAPLAYVDRTWHALGDGSAITG